MVGFQKVLRDKVVLLIGVASVVALSVFLSNRYDQSQITPKDTASAELLTKKDFDICQGVKYGIPNYGDEAKRRLLTLRKCEQLKKHDSAQNAPKRAASPENLLKKKAELTKKAEQGQAGAQFELGGMYFNGDGVPQNISIAINWFRKAAKQGHVSAQYNLGAILFRAGEYNRTLTRL